MEGGRAGADVFEGIKNVLNNIERLKTSQHNLFHADNSSD